MIDRHLEGREAARRAICVPDASPGKTPLLRGFAPSDPPLLLTESGGHGVLTARAPFPAIAVRGYTRPMTRPMRNPFMARAIEIAIENARSGRGGPFGAVIVKDGAIIAEGANGVTATNDPTAHAEIVAIRAACAKLGLFQLNGFDLYASCEPCPMCLGAIYWVRPARVYFAGTAADASRAGFDDEFIYSEIPLPPAKRKLPMIQMMREDALEAFRVWQARPNKIAY